MKNMKPYPFVKWAGGKRQLLPEINKNLPKELLNNEIEKYVEPFVGGGAVLFDLVQKFQFKEIIINDYNEDLINLYKHIRDEVDNLIDSYQIFPMNICHWKMKKERNTITKSEIYIITLQRIKY